MMKKIFTLITLFATATACLAQTISESTAREKASQFFKGNASFARGTQPQAPVLAYTAKYGDSPCFYVYNDGNAGFVIIGGDDAAKEILGYSDNGAFDYDKAPENLKWWLSEYTREIGNAIAQVKAGKATIAKNVAHTASATKSDISPLVTAKWNQSEPYNNNLPKMTFAPAGHQDLVTGCVATAAAQVMHKWKHPEAGTGITGYTLYYTQNTTYSNYYDVTSSQTSNSITFTPGNYTYDWTNMTDTYSSSSTEAQNTAVAQLMSDVGIASQMSYSNSESGTAQEKLGQALVANFGYSKNINNRYRDNYTDTEWEDLVYAELAAGRPLIYGGQSNSGGHEFVVCGYQSSDNMFYVNWGWGGSYNNYFLLTATDTQKALTPDGTGTGGGAAGSSYTGSQTFLQNVQPEDGDAQRCYMYTCGFGLYDGTTGGSSLSVSAGTEVSMVGYNNVTNSGALWNAGSSAINTDLGIRLKSTSTTIDIPYGSGTINPGSGYRLSFTPTEAGTFTVIPIYKSAGEWVEARTSTSIAYPTLTVTGSATGLTVVGDYGFENGAYTTKDNMKYSVTIKNNGDACSKDIVAFIFPQSGGNSIGYFFKTVSFNANETKALTFTNSDLSADLSEGTTYLIRVENYTDSKYITSVQEFTVTAATNISYTMSSEGWGTICLPFCADVPSGLTAYSVNSITDKTLNLVEASSLKMNTPYILSGTAGSYSFSGPNTPAGTYASGLLIGTTATGQKAPKGSYVLQKNSGSLAFYKVAEADSQVFTQYRACIYSPKATFATLENLLLPEPTGISSVNADLNANVNDGAAYNLAGQRVSPYTKGIVIINGKKVYNK